MASNTYKFREVDKAHDDEFLMSVYASTRDDLKMIGMPVESLNLLIALQYRAQTEQYRLNYPAATHHIICQRDEQIGRLIVERGATEILLVDVALLPEFRNRGVGGTVVHGLIEEAEASDRTFVLHVRKMNPAVRLYKRLGCEITGDTGTHLRMERRRGLVAIRPNY